MEKHGVCKSCHWGRALVAGVVAGLSAGLFARSEKGEQLTKEAKQAVHELQKELMKKLKQTEHFSKAEYDTTVKEIIGHYRRSKDFSADEMSDMQEFLSGQWEAMQKELLK